MSQNTHYLSDNEKCPSTTGKMSQNLGNTQPPKSDIRIAPLFSFVYAAMLIDGTILCNIFTFLIGLIAAGVLFIRFLEWTEE